MHDTLKSETSNRAILHAEIMGALKIMPEKLRKVFVLTHYEDLSKKEIALRTRVPEPELHYLVGEANSAFHLALSDSRLVDEDPGR